MATLIVVGIAFATAGCGAASPVADPSVSSSVLEAHRGQNNLVTLLPARTAVDVNAADVTSTLTALRLLRLAGDPAEPIPSWIADGLAAELDGVVDTADPFKADLIRHACVLAEAACADPAAHRKQVVEALKVSGPPDPTREAYARMAYELGVHVDLDGEVTAAEALADRELLCVAAAFELADPGSTDVKGAEGFWDAMVDYLAEGDVLAASCASWLWRVGTGGHGDDTDRALRQAVERTYHVGDDGLWRSKLSPEGDLALSLHLYEVIGLS